MKKSFMALLFLGLTVTAKSQNTSVEKSVFGVQTGLFGLWGHNELRLSSQIALRSELGLNFNLWGGSFYEKTGFLLAPVITAEPRWYYNLNRRASKSKRTDGNTGNFLSVKTSFHPDWFVISNYENLQIVSDVFVVPSYGIRRSIGKHVNYETGFGLAYLYYFAKKAGYAENKSYIDIELNFRIGYRF